MHQLSLKYFDCHWAKKLEYHLFLQLSGLRFKGYISISKAEEEKLREATQAVMGWYHWGEEEALPEFITWRKWERLYNEWHTKNILFRNLRNRHDA